MAESFKYVRSLIETERYKIYKKEFWGGCDVIVLSKKEYLNRKDSITKWQNNDTLRKYVKTEYATEIIWLIETLKPYINCDYLDKFDYYSELADFLNNKIKDKQNPITDVKKLLFETVDFVEMHKWEKILKREELENNHFIDWYNFGIEHNDPFFIKFVTLWMAFNERYKTPENLSERDEIETYCRKHADKFEKVHEAVFNSPFIKIFMKESVKDMRFNYKNTTRFNKLKNETGIDQTNALLQTIYQVRCNLFHGSKCPEEQRDIDLVRSSGEIMEIYMRAIMN